MLKGLIKEQEEEEKDKNINQTAWQKREITHKEKDIIKAVGRSTINLVQRVKGKTRKNKCTYNNKLRSIQKHTHKGSKDQNIKREKGE